MTIVGIPFGSRNASLTWNFVPTIDLIVSSEGPEYTRELVWGVNGDEGFEETSLIPKNRRFLVRRVPINLNMLSRDSSDSILDDNILYLEPSSYCRSLVAGSAVPAEALQTRRPVVRCRDKPGLPPGEL